MVDAFEAGSNWNKHIESEKLESKNRIRAKKYTHIFLHLSTDQVDQKEIVTNRGKRLHAISRGNSLLSSSSIASPTHRGAPF